MCVNTIIKKIYYQKKKISTDNLTIPIYLLFNFSKTYSTEIREPPSLIINLARRKGCSNANTHAATSANENILTAERQLLNRRFYSLISRLR